MSLRLFRSAAHEARYCRAYESTMALWPVPHRAYTVATSQGRTHVVDSGLRDWAPIVLLPWGGASSAVWHRNIAGLSRTHRTLALDIMCDAGRSVPNRPFRTEADYVRWLTEVLDALELDRVHLVGGSYGGFIALIFALNAPQRVERVALLAPAASFGKLSLRFWLRVLGPGILPLDRVIVAFYRHLAVRPLDPAFVQQGVLSRTCVRYLVRVAPRVLTDEELERLTVPVLLLIGGEDFIYRDASAALKRCCDLVPCGCSELIPNAGHLLTMDQPDRVNDRVLEFFESAAWPASGRSG